MALDTGLIEQMTDIRPPAAARPSGSSAAGQDKSDAKSSDANKVETSQQFLERQEKELISAVRERGRLRDAEEGKRKREHPRKPFDLKPRQTISDLQLCPNEKCVIAMIDEEPEGAKRDDVPSYVTDSGYTESVEGRTNVGDKQTHSRIAVLDTETGEAKFVDTGLGEREVSFFRPIFNERGSYAAMIVRAVDNKDRWIMALDTASAKGRTIFTEHDDAWIGGPGEDVLGWLKNSDEAFFLSERDGYCHLYKVAAGGGAAKQLTSGKFEVLYVWTSRDGLKFYMTTNEVSPAERHLYSMTVDGGARTKVTTNAGNHRVTLSMDEKLTADVYSYVNKPPELFVGENRPGANLEKRTDSPSRDFWDYPWLDAPIVQVPARDGTMIPARFF
jgi:hypothetical protein